jgi:CheY-like chemotaxis protein
LVPVLSQKYYLQKPFGIEVLKAKLRNLVPSRLPKSQRILLVDPNAALRSFKRLGLISEGFEVDAVGDAAEAIERLRLQNYDAVVSENESGSLDGLELWQAIRNNPNLRSLRMILASKSLEDPQLRDRAEALGLKDLVILGPGDFGSLALELRRRL